MKSYSPRNGNKITSRHVIDDIDVCMYTDTLSSPFPSIGWYIERATMHVPSLIELKRRFARNEKEKGVIAISFHYGRVLLVNMEVRRLRCPSKHRREPASRAS